MSWKDLDIRLKAELIKLGVLSGIRDIKLIRLLYDDNNTPTLVVELSYNETNVRPLLGIERIKLEYGIPEEEVNKANEIIQLIENEISLEEINNQLPVLFRLFKNGRYKDGNDKTNNEKNKTYGPYELPAVIITPDSLYNEFINSLPDNHKYTPEEDYRMYKYWQLWGKPKNFLYTLNNPNEDGDYMFNWDTSDSSYHGSSIAWGDDGVGYFIKPKHHETLKYELDYFNKGLITEEGGIQRTMTPEEQKEWEDFKSRYTLKDDGNFYKYVPKDKGGYISNNPTLVLVGKVKKYDEGGLKDSNIILDYIFNGPLKRKKENSLEYRQALFNNVDPRNGYPSPWTAVKYYNTVVDALNSGDTSKKWETDGSIGQETATAGWAKYLDLPYNKELFPVWNGDTVRLSPELEREIPIDTNLLKLDILEIRYNRDMDRSMGIFDREEAYKTLLLTKQLALNNLRKTYKTGEWVQMNEFMGNSVNPFDWNEDYVSPLNVLLFYGLKYDKNTNSMLYGDLYNLNAFDYFLPGKPFIIRGSIPLDKKKNGGFIFPNLAFSHKF